MEFGIKTISTDALQKMFARHLPDIHHFSPKEYLYDKTFDHWAELEYTGYNIEDEVRRICYLLHPLLKNLEDVRKHFKHSVIITNGVRDVHLWRMLRQAGYLPSPHTDHSYGLSYNKLGVGAIDHYVVGVDIHEVYNYEREHFANNTGQLILYRKSRFIHMSNTRKLVYDEEFIERVFNPYTHFIEWDH